MKLRDHDRRCEHGETGAHANWDGSTGGPNLCPGGREITIDYEAAVAYARKHLPGAAALAPSLVGLIYGAVDAALRVNQ